MSVVFNAAIGSSSGVDTGDIPYSLRFRRAASASVSTGVTTDATSTYFAFFKQGALDAVNPIFDGNIKINANNTITAFGLTTSAVKRDPTSFHWIHVSNNGLVFDGVNLGSVTTSAITNLRIGYDGTNYADMYGARMCCVSGSSLAYTDFVYFNSEINEWVVKSQSAIKALVDTGGAASFMYEFDNATSLTTLGYDKSSKGNNATLNNFSLTAGTSYDHMLDVPGNSFATLNSIIPSAANITNGCLTSGTTAVRATQNALAYDCKWEVTAGGSAVTAGVISSTGTTNTTTVTANKTFAFRLTTSGALDYKNVTDSGAWTSITTGLSGEQYPYGTTAAANWNFGQAPLHASATYQSSAGGYFYDTTTGYKALCQRNMPDPAILNPELHFDVVTQLGSAVNTGANLLAQFTQFTTDLAWGKDRAAVNNHQLVDTVRGSTAVLQSNTTAAETTYSAPTSGDNCVAWGWKAGGAAVTNNAGSISSQVSANVEAGFSIVTYQSPNNAADQTVGHGLTKVPGLIIAKNRISGALNWVIYHSALASGYGLSFTTAASTAGRWPTTAPTSSVFSTKNTYEHNGTDTYVAYCFAEIPGFSKIFSYTGNGSADGPFVHCGFKPKFVLWKRSDTAGNNWAIQDSLRSNPYNPQDGELLPSSSAVESTSFSKVDLLSSGFKIRSTNAGENASGSTYIFIAFADVPQKYSLGR